MVSGELLGDQSSDHPTHSHEEEVHASQLDPAGAVLLGYWQLQRSHRNLGWSQVSNVYKLYNIVCVTMQS